MVKGIGRWRGVPLNLENRTAWRARKIRHLSRRVIFQRASERRGVTSQAVVKEWVDAATDAERRDESLGETDPPGTPFKTYRPIRDCTPKTANQSQTVSPYSMHCYSKQKLFSVSQRRWNTRSVGREIATSDGQHGTSPVEITSVFFFFFQIGIILN